MRKKERRAFTREFKVEAVRLCESGRGVAEVARELGISDSLLRRWRAKLAASGTTTDAFPGNGKLTSTDEEVRALRREVATLRMERDILKKATAFFARESR